MPRSAFAAGQAAAGVVSASVAALVRAASRSLVVSKLHVGALLLVAATVAAGVGGLAQRPDAKELPTPRDAEQPKAEATPQKLTDRHGDPLPLGAIARMGTVRFRDGDGIFALAYSPNGKLLASGTGGYREGVIRLWDASTGKQLFLLQPHAGQVHALDFSPDVSCWPP